jgi:CoA:oxalate CoA-transferase
MEFNILNDIKVLDLSQIIAGPLASMVLGDLGADVIKIEPPEGEAARHLGETFLQGESDYLLSLNRNKRSLVIDLKRKEGREIFYNLVRKSDVVLENFRPGTMEKLGLDYERLSSLNRQIIYCSISGFGQNGPYKNRPAMDPIIQAMGGIMAITGNPQTGPQKVGAPIGDFVAPLLAVIGILGALRIRDKTGEGQRIDISMLDGMIFSLIPREGYYFIKGKTLPLRGNEHFQIAPCNTYRTKDEEYIMVIAHTQKHWENFCKALDRRDLLEDEKFKTNTLRLCNGQELNHRLQEIFAAKTRGEWLEALSSQGVMIAPVYNFEQLFQDPQVIHDQVVSEMEHPVAGTIKVLNTPIGLSKTPPRIKTPPPLLGQHTNEILLRFGFTKIEIQKFREMGVVGGK